MSNIVLWAIIISGPIAILVSAWMAIDLWLDKKAARRNNINDLVQLQVTTALRLEIITMIKGWALFTIGYFAFANVYGWGTPFLDNESRLLVNRIAIFVVVVLMPVRAIWDRIDRIRANWKLKVGRNAN